MSDIVAKLRDYSEGPTWHWAKVCDEAADEIERLRKDAERYRWLRLREVEVSPKRLVPPHKSDHLDAAIDAVMNAGEQA